MHFDYQERAKKERIAREAFKKFWDTTWIQGRNLPLRERIQRIKENPQYYKLLKAWVDAWDATFPEEFDQYLENLQCSDPYAIEMAIQYLESDLYTFRSGYIKQMTITRVKRAQLNDNDKERLRQVILNVVDSYDRREFRYYCRLALRLDSQAFREALNERLTSRDSGIRRRARWVLNYLEGRN
jgi:hypothetical protein